MKKNIPTVDDLVKIFKDNNWIPERTNGAYIDNILDGKCCAIPAIARFIDPNYSFEEIEESQEIYNFVSSHYGKNQCQSLYFGFDNLPLKELNEQFYNLGKELYKKLTETVGE